MQLLGKWLIVAGILAVLAGILLISGRAPPTFGLGRLPGDIYIERGGARFYMPLTTSLIISLFLTGLLYLISRFR